MHHPIRSWTRNALTPAEPSRSSFSRPVGRNTSLTPLMTFILDKAVRPVSRLLGLRFDMDRSESRLRVASTPAPVPFAERLPPVPPEVPHSKSPVLPCWDVEPQRGKYGRGVLSLPRCHHFAIRTYAGPCHCAPAGSHGSLERSTVGRGVTEVCPSSCLVIGDDLVMMTCCCCCCCCC